VTVPCTRRRFIAAALACLAASDHAGAASADAGVALTPQQSRAFRAWMVQIVAAQLERGPTPRWRHRDCAGLVRFAVAEAMREHDEKWKRANGLDGRPLPPEVALGTAQEQALRHRWRLADGTYAAYAAAIDLVQENTRPVSRDCNLARAADLLFFDQGDDQHVMVWMGSFIAYHTGTETPTDAGLRAVTLPQLLRWSDTRWQPDRRNPNFAGVFRLNFLTA
jgi:uncharacterized protein YfaT (DUF1175 family)